MSVFNNLPAKPNRDKPGKSVISVNGELAAKIDALVERARAERGHRYTRTDIVRLAVDQLAGAVGPIGPAPTVV